MFEPGSFHLALVTLQSLQYAWFVRDSNTGVCNWTVGLQIVANFPAICLLYLSLEAFASLWKATIGFVRWVCPSFRKHERTGLQPDEFSWNVIYIYMYIYIYENLSKIQAWLNYEMKASNLHENVGTVMVNSGWIVIRMSCVSDKIWREFHNTLSYSINILRNYIFYQKMCRKDSRAKHATGCNIIQHRNNALCILDNWGYRHTLRLCNNCWFSTPTMVKRKRLSDTLYLQCLSFFSNMLTQQLKMSRYYGTHIRQAQNKCTVFLV